MEYLVLGKAIVAPSEPNLLEVLTDSENALLFDGRTAEGLESVLTRLSEDEALRRRLAIGASATIEKLQLTWIANARKVTALAEKAVNVDANE